MSQEFHRAFEKRQMGDYADDFLLSKAEAIEILQSAMQFVDSIRSHMSARATLNKPNSK